MKLKHGIIALTALALVHCSHNDSTPSDDGDLQAPAVPVKIDDQTSLTPEEKRVYGKLEKNQPISFREITKLMLQKHVTAAKETRRGVEESIVQAFIDQIKPPPGTSAAKTKVAYENAIKAKAAKAGQKYLYNKDKINIVDTQTEFRMQCYSGTYMYELVRRQAGAAAFHANHEVVIFQSGHVLPGYMVQDWNRSTKKQEWKLLGLETTVLGGRRKDFGFVSYGLQGSVVVDADLFALSEIYGSDMSNPREFVTKAIQYTAQKYGIKDPEVTNDQASPDFTETKRQLNSSLFAFGIADTAPGDQEIADSGDDGSGSDLYPPEAVAVPQIDMLAERLKGDCNFLAGRYLSEPADRMLNVFIFPSGSCKQIIWNEEPYKMVRTGFRELTLIREDGGKKIVLHVTNLGFDKFDAEVPERGTVHYIRENGGAQRVEAASPFENDSSDQ